MTVLRYLLLAGVASGALFAQERSPVSFGLLGGVPITDMFQANNTTLFNNQLPNSSYTAGAPRYEVGASAEFGLFGPLQRFRFEVDGIYKRAGFDLNSGTQFDRTSFNNWEIPGLFKYNFSVSHIRPFVEVGASLRHISGLTDYSYPAGFQTPLTVSENNDALHNRNSYGGVAGFGVKFKKGPVSITPQVRYTRWANQSFLANGLRTNLDQGDALIGISF